MHGFSIICAVVPGAAVAQVAAEAADVSPFQWGLLARVTNKQTVQWGLQAGALFCMKAYLVTWCTEWGSCFLYEEYTTVYTTALY
jgi:hypothetical protein